MQQTTPLGEGRDLRSLAGTAWRRRWVVLIPTLAGLLAGLLIGHPRVLRPVYRASATLLLDFPQQVGRELQGMVTTSGMREQLSRLQTVLQSNEFLLRVASSTGLRDDPAIRKWVAKSRKRYPDMTEDELIDLRVTQWLRGVIRMDQERNAENVIRIQFEGYYPDRVHLVVQHLVQGVIEANRDAQLERVRSLHDFSLEQLVIYKQRLTDAEAKLEEFQRGIAVREATGRPLDPAAAAKIPGLRASARNELKERTQQYDDLRFVLEERSPNVAAVVRALEQETTWSDAVGEVQGLERRYAEEMLSPPGTAGSTSETYALLIGRRLQELDPVAVELVLKRLPEISDSVERDAATLLLAYARLKGTEARLEKYDDLLARLQADLGGTPRQETTLRRLRDEVETNRALYNAFVQQLASTQISEAFETTIAGGRLTVLEPPSRPLSPVKPKRAAIAALATIIGFLLGLAALLLVERHDLTFRDSREAERTLGLRVLGTLPQIEGAGRRTRGNAGGWTASRIDDYLQDSPAYLEMRRVVLQMRSEEESLVRSLLVTSTRGGEGKTTSVILLGAAAAVEEPRTPILLADLDLRRGSLGRMFHIDAAAPGVVQALETRSIEEGWFHKTSIPNLRVLSLGALPAPRNDLLTFESLSWLLPELTRRYGFVIIDSPPNLPVPDPLVIGQLVDAVMLVIKAGSTPRSMVERGVELQKQFTGNLRGLLMNNVDETMPYYYNYRYYRYPSRVAKARKRERSR